MKIAPKRLVQDFKVIRSNALLIPNKNHKNFTRSRETLQKDTIVKGFLIDINGERRGKPFVYKLLRLIEPKYKRQYIFAKAVQLNSPIISQPTAQPTVEKTVSADGNSTFIKMTQNETNISIKNIIGATTGGVIGYALAKKQNKTSFKSIIIYTSIGSILGFLVAKNFFKKSGIIVQQ
jgi:hypothetical protein